MPGSDEHDEHEGPETSRSGVRAKLAPSEHRVLIVHPDPTTRGRLEREASELEVPLLLATDIDRAVELHTNERLTFVACFFPLAGSVPLVRQLRRERFPVAVVTRQVARAIAMFGFEVPLLHERCALAQILTVADELASPTPAPEPSMLAASGDERPGAITEIVLSPRSRDPRRE